MRDEKEGAYRGGRRDSTCEHTLSGRMLRVKPLVSLAGK